MCKVAFVAFVVCVVLVCWLRPEFVPLRVVSGASDSLLKVRLACFASLYFIMTTLRALVDCNGFCRHFVLAFRDIKYMPFLLFSVCDPQSS
jgi:hypothetical protein